MERDSPADEKRAERADDESGTGSQGSEPESNPTPAERSSTEYSLGNHWLGAGHPLGPETGDTRKAAGNPSGRPQHTATDEQEVPAGVDSRTEETADATDEPSGNSASHLSADESDESSEPTQSEDRSSIRSAVSMNRRRVLGSVAGIGGLALSVVGLRAYRESSREGATALAEEYVHAIGVDDWEHARSFVHPESRKAADIDAAGSYEAYLEQAGHLNLFEIVDPVIEGIHILRHVPTLTEETMEGLFLRGDPEPDFVDEYKTVAVFTAIDHDTVDIGNLSERPSASYLGPESSLVFTLTVIRDGAEWALLDMTVNP